jgi:hypothetical protein
METSYVYKWTHKPTQKWYIGSRTNKAAHPDDGYICSSQIVKPLILANPSDWERKIIATGSSKEMRKKEQQLLKLYNAAKNPMSYNRSNWGGPVEGSGRKKGTKTKIYAQYPDCHHDMLSKKTTNEIVEIYLDSKNDPWIRYLMNNFILTKVIL